MKRALAMVAFCLVLVTAAQAQAGNHIGIGRWFGLGWGSGYHARGASGGYGVVEYEGPLDVPAPEAVNTSRLTPTPRVPATHQVPLSAQSPAATSVLRARGEARRPVYGPVRPAQ